MLLTCPYCTTIFRVDADLISQGGQAVRCSICHHIWVASPAPLLADQSVILSVGGAVAALQLPAVDPLSAARGWLRNRSMSRTHAADLVVTVRGADGTTMKETVIRSDHEVIDA